MNLIPGKEVPIYLPAATSALETDDSKLDSPSSSTLFSSGYSFGGYILVKCTSGSMGPKYMFGLKVLK